MVFSRFILLCLFFLSLALSSVASSEEKSIEERLEDLEKQTELLSLESMELSQLTRSINEGFEVSGFITAALAKVDVDENVQWGNEGPDDEFDFNSDSIVGLQVSYQLSDDLYTTVQLVSKGGFNSNFDADWFYIKYRANEQLDILLGRVRPQFFMLSEYVHVGFAYPWIRPPVEVYDPIPTDAGQGISVNYRTHINKLDISTFLQFLQSEDQGTVSQFDAQMLIAALELSYKDWTIGFRKTDMKVDILLQNETLRLGSDSLESVSRNLAALPKEDSEVEGGDRFLKI